MAQPKIFTEYGQVLALVGPSGGGKSSCIALLENLYQPSAGQVKTLTAAKKKRKKTMFFFLSFLMASTCSALALVYLVYAAAALVGQCHVIV